MTDDEREIMELEAQIADLKAHVERDRPVIEAAYAWLLRVSKATPPSAEDVIVYALYECDDYSGAPLAKRVANALREAGLLKEDA